jgi:hypothetical protein
MLLTEAREARCLKCEKFVTVLALRKQFGTEVTEIMVCAACLRRLLRTLYRARVVTRRPPA